MGKINLLPVEISNKIAAGEVVERPASAIKELVENAIDAGADAINVEIKNGGTTYIRVTDNGSGMSRDDAVVAFLPHATSKISVASDLEAIYTLGFRGEALSSIGAVAKVELLTKRFEDEIGTRITCCGGVIDSPTDVGVPDGTTFTITNLFYNTPARMNFMKKDAAETAAITDIIERFILSHPEISFRYTTDGKEKYFTSGNGDLTGCIYAVYGKSYAKSIIPISYETELLKITGAIGKGDVARPNRGYQSFYVNKRYIRSMRISSAVQNAYKNQIMIGKYPMAILNIEINPRHIDVNVHPTKLDVKFSREEDVMRAIYHAVQNALYAIPNVPQIEHTPVKTTFSRDTVTTSAQVELAPVEKSEPNPTPAPVIEPKPTPVIEEKPKPVVEQKNEVNAEKPTDTPESYALFTPDNYFESKRDSIVSSGLDASELVQEAAEEIATENADKLSQPINPMELVVQDEPSETMPAADNPWGFNRDNLHVLGQVFDTYILAESGDTMIIADQHAAHERLKFEELKRELSQKQVTSQMLMFPVTCELTANEYVIFCENADKFAEMGFEIEEFGANTLLIRATPEALDADELSDLIVELLEKFQDTGAQIMTDKMERVLYTIACKAAVKANHKYSLKELETLLNAVLDLENINTCPHGRPIIITMTKKELEKEFKRIV